MPPLCKALRLSVVHRFVDIRISVAELIFVAIFTSAMAANALPRQPLKGSSTEWDQQVAWVDNHF